MAKKVIIPKGFTKCDACGATYKIGAPHQIFCEVNTCEDCGTSYPGGVEKDEDGRRVCANCKGGVEEEEDDWSSKF